MADDLKTLFATHGITMIGPVAELSAAMKLIDDGGFDIAVIDLDLNDHLVHSLAEQLERQNIPFVFAADDKARTSAGRFGSVACWRKPLEPATALDHLAVLCERAAAKIVPIDPKG
jgi:DNA-binding response OmpR family regulator